MSFSGNHSFGGSDFFDDENIDGKDHGGRPNKFLYTGKKQKTDPWGADDPAEFADVKAKSTTNNKRSNSPSGFDLDDVWSIRRNVQVSQNARKGPATNININNTVKSSFYSRHGGLIGNGDGENSLSTKRAKRDTGGSQDPSEHKSWNTQSRSHYSYSDQQQSDALGDGDREFEFDPLMKSSNSNEDSFVQRKNQVNARHAMPGAPQPAVREMSARTQRAHKMQEAQHKSMGLGQFSPGSNPYFRQLDENENKVKWKRNDDFL